MTNEEFKEIYRHHTSELYHGWVSSKIAEIAAKQKERERQYNREYYQQHSEKWKKKHSTIAKNAKTPVRPTRDEYSQNISDMKKIAEEYDRAVREYARNPLDMDKLATVARLFDKYKSARSKQKYLEKKTPSQLASEAQKESAIRRASISQRFERYKANRSTADKIVDKADIVIEKARRKVDNLLSKLKNK